MSVINKNPVTIISTATVRSPADDHQDRRVELAPWDLKLLLWGPIQKGLLFHKPKDTTTDLLIHRLKASLSRTLSFFPPLAGRLSRTDNDDGATASFFIDCNNAGARFVHATADSVSVSDIVGPAYVPPVVASLFPLNGVGNKEDDAQPLLGVQVTELDDGIFIGCTVNHVISDGNSFWHFLNSWSEISRGHDTLLIMKPPSLQRWFRGESPIRIPLTQLEGERVLRYRDFKPLNLAERIFHFGKESVAELKARANLEATGMDGRISSLQAMLAHLWRSVIRSRGIESEGEEIAFIFAVGARSRLQQLREQYFGNALEMVTITMKASEVVGHGIGHVAGEFNKTIGSFTQEVMETKLDQWVTNPTLPKIWVGDVTRNNFLVVSSSPRFNVYGNDFGWGRPVAVRNGGANKFAGKLTLFSGVDPGSIEVQACLPPQTLRAMEKDVELMNMVTA